MEITARINLILWLLTGRSGGFGGKQDLQFSLTYATASPSEDVLAARELLRLNDDRTDFFVMGALASAYAVLPLLREIPAEKSTVFMPALYSPSDVSVTGAELVPATGPSWPFIRNVPADLDSVITKARFTATAGEPMLCTTDLWEKEMSYALSGKDVLVSGAEGMGIHGAFRVANPAHIDVRVTMPPSVYPYASVVEAIGRNSAMLRLMNSTGTVSTFASAADVVSKTGALTAAIILRQYRDSVTQGLSVLRVYQFPPP